MKKMLLLIVLINFIASCCNDDSCMEPPQVNCLENYTGPLDIVWSVPLRADSSYSNSITPVIKADKVIFSNLMLNETNVLYAFDKETGTKLWELNDFPHPEEPFDFLNTTQSFDNKLYLNIHHSKILVNTDIPEVEWISNQSFSNHRLSAGTNHLYYIQYYDENNNNSITSSELFRTSKEGLPNWESIYYEEGSGGSRIFFDPPAEWINAAGDTLLIFVRSRVELPTKADLLAYNISKDELAWEIIKFGETETTGDIPIIQGNLVYITNARSISCVDLEQGVELWETQDLGTSFANTGPVLGGDKIFVNGDDGRVRGINLADGSVAWQHTSGNNPTDMGYYEGGLYYCTNSTLTEHLYGVDTNTGQRFWKLESPNVDCNSSAEFNRGLSIDQETGRMYMIDNIFALCIQLEPR